MTAKKHFMILDTETASTARIPFDIAYTIIDRKGNIVKQANYLVKELFNTPLGQHLITHDDFSKNKIKNYIETICGNAQQLYFSVIRDRIRADVKEFNCTVVAYNAKFDYECLTNFAMSFGYDNFFENDTEVWDLWNIALTILADSKRYVKFCQENGFTSEKGNLKTSAEIMYRYLTNNLDFEEAHTALDDTEIEAAIMTACLKRHKKMETDFITQVFRHPVWRERCKA